MKEYKIFGVKKGNMISYKAHDIESAAMLLCIKFDNPSGIIRKEKNGWQFVCGTLDFADWFKNEFTNK